MGFDFMRVLVAIFLSMGVFLFAGGQFASAADAPKLFNAAGAGTAGAPVAPVAIVPPAPTGMKTTIPHDESAAGQPRATLNVKPAPETVSNKNEVLQETRLDRIKKEYSDAKVDEISRSSEEKRKLDLLRAESLKDRSPAFKPRERKELAKPKRSFNID